MAQEIFKRYEKKYMLPGKQDKELLPGLMKQMKIDEAEKILPAARADGETIPLQLRKDWWTAEMEHWTITAQERLPAGRLWGPEAVLKQKPHQPPHPVRAPGRSLTVDSICLQ